MREASTDERREKVCQRGIGSKFFSEDDIIKMEEAWLLTISLDVEDGAQTTSVINGPVRGFFEDLKAKVRKLSVTRYKDMIILTEILFADARLAQIADAAAKRDLEIRSAIALKRKSECFMEYCAADSVPALLRQMTYAAPKSHGKMEAV